MTSSYDDVNDADRLGRDPAMRWVVGGKAIERQAASTSQMGRFETEVVETGILPTLDIGIAGSGGGQIGAGSVWAPMECFEKAKAAWEAKYGG